MSIKISGYYMNFFEISKIGWFFVEPDNMLIMLVLLGGLLTLSRFKRIGRGLIVFAFLCVLAVAGLPIDNMIIVPLETRYPVLTSDTLPKKVDGIIVLGGAVSPPLSNKWGQMQIVGSAERVTAMAELAKAYPSAVVVYTGGSGSLLNQADKEADYVREWLNKTDAKLAKRIVFENQSRNTYENAIFSKALVKPQTEQVWLLVTSAFHMPRSKAIFDKAVWQTVPYPVDFQTDGTIRGGHGFDFIGNMTLIKTALHEYLGMLAYKLSGKI